MRKGTMTKINIIGAVAYRHGFREKYPGVWNHASRPFRFRLSPRKLRFEVCVDSRRYKPVFGFWINQIDHSTIKAVEHYLDQHF